MFRIEDVGVFLGLDVGKAAHHGHGLTPAGKKVFEKPAAKFGTVLVVADQPASVGALPLTVARDAGCRVAYLPLRRARRTDRRRPRRRHPRPCRSAVAA
jgi:hypothetical protein